MMLSMEPLDPKNQFPLQDITAPSPIPKPRPEPYPEPTNQIPAIRTYSTDLAEALKEQQGSMVKIAIAEDERRHEDAAVNSPTSGKNISWIAASLIALGIAAIAVLGILWYKNKQSAAVQPVPVVTPESIIQTEQFSTLDISGKSRSEIMQLLAASDVDERSNIGVMKNILITENVVGVQTRVPAADLLTKINARIPADFARALEKDYVFGVYLYNHSNRFLVLKATAHDYLASGLIKWEPYMVQDLGAIFGLDVEGKDAAVKAAPFSDILLKNQNVRAVLSPDGLPALFYSFLDPNTVFIAADPNTLTEAVRRFGTK